MSFSVIGKAVEIKNRAQSGAAGETASRTTTGGAEQALNDWFADDGGLNFTLASPAVSGAAPAKKSSLMDDSNMKLLAIALAGGLAYVAMRKFEKGKR